MKNVMPSIFCCVLLIANIQTKAQNRNKFGKLSGGIESNAQYYNEKDEAIGFVAPLDRFRSNNYLKLDYEYKGFTTGIQYEAYTPLAILGYPENLNKRDITNYYVGYRRKKYNITLGHFYEQFDNGILLRSWEDRQLGINNAIYGGRLVIQPNDDIEVKFIYGKKRNAFELGEGIIWGSNFNFNLNEILKLNDNQKFSINLSYVGKEESYTGIIKNYPEKVHSFSVASKYDKNNFSIEAMYAIKTPEGVVNELGNLINSDKFFGGDVLQINTSYTKKNSGLSANIRKVNNFASRTDRKAGLNQLLLNYVPALTKQHHFSLANIYVYNPQTRFAFLPGNILNAAGEIGAQIEWYKNFPKNSKWGGKYGAKLEINFSNYFGLKYNGSDLNSTSISSFGLTDANFRDFNIEFKKNFNKKLKLNISFISLLYNQKVIEGFGNEKLQAQIIVTEGIYKLKNSASFRFDVQHMWVKNGKGNWAAATAEYNFNSKINLFFADLYNYGNDFKQIHYFNVGTTFTNGSFRIMGSYGRQREGLICVGGVCRQVPASTGFSLSTSYNF